MRWLLALPVLVALLLLVLGAATRRIKLRSCCAIVDARSDLRMRDAFLDEPPNESPAGQTVT